MSSTFGWAVNLLLLMLIGCSPDSVPPPAPPLDGVLDRPQAVAFIGDRLVVANTAYRSNGWGDGSITVLDPQDGTLLRSIPVPLNPQRIRVVHDTLWVLSTGPFGYTDETVESTGDGALTTFSIDDLRQGTSTQIPIEHLIAPVDLAIDAKNALLTSALDNAVLPFDPQTGAFGDPIQFGTDRLSLGSVAAWSGGYVVADFNTDQLFIFEADATPWPCAIELGRTARDVEGAQSIVVADDVAYIVLALSGSIVRVDLAALTPDCTVAVQTVVSPAGAIPNDLHVHRNHLVVVDSGHNEVVAYTFDGEFARRWQLPIGSNPWHVAFSPDGQRFAVTTWNDHGITLFDWDLEHPIWTQNTETLPPKPASSPGNTGTSVDTVVEARTQIDDPRFNDPERAINGAQGAGEFAGGLDVFSLSHDPDDALIVSWSSKRLRDGPGFDLVVFENGFISGEESFIDLLTVEISPDGTAWVAFPHDYIADDETEFVPRPEAWSGFAGRTPTRLHTQDNPVDPFGPEAGGDAFDLADLPGVVGERVRREGALQVRLRAAAAQINPDTGVLYPHHPVANGPDIDAIYGRLVD